MPGTNIETPDWLRDMETIFEELNEGVMVVDDQLRVIFANEAVLRMGHFERDEIQGHTPDAIFPSEDLPFVKQHESGHRYGPGFWVDCGQTLPWDCFTLARHPPSGPAAKPANRC